MIFNKLLTDFDSVVQKVDYSIDNKKPLLLTYLNQHCFNIYFTNKDYKNLLDTKFNVYQADLGIYLALRFLHKKNVNKIDATNMNEMLLDKLKRDKVSLALVGGDFDEKFIMEESHMRGINIVAYKNGFFDNTKTEDLISFLKNKDFRVCIVGMGVPKQEIFAEKLGSVLNNAVVICVGNFLEFYFGTKKRAPIFIQKIGFEWLFRLISEPVRLWKRYLVGIPVFVYRVLKLRIRKIYI